MSRRTVSRILMLGSFLLSVMMGAEVMAQNLPIPSTSGMGQQTHPAKGGENHSAAEHNPACQRILSECKRLGFIQGQWKKDDGLWKDCFDPVVKGNGDATRDGKPIHVPVSASDVQACRASEGHHRQER